MFYVFGLSLLSLILQPPSPLPICEKQEHTVHSNYARQTK